MHIKFLKKGSGDAGAAAAYLVQDKDAAGKVREEVKILRGDPSQVASVANALDFKHRYTSGVISWAPEDRPTDPEIESVLDDFEKTAWAGLEPDRYSWTAVLHREQGGGCHVHVFSARCDLATGKSLNIAPPGHQTTFDPLRDYYNHSKGWARPDDLMRARLFQPGHRAYIDAKKLRAGLQVEPDPRQLVTDYLVARIKAGEIDNRQDILTALHEAGFATPRAGKNYVTVLYPDTDQKFRLKGFIYNADLRAGDLTALQKNRPRPAGGGVIDKKLAAAALKALQKKQEERAAYNKDRFPLKKEPEIKELGQLKISSNLPGDPEQLRQLARATTRAVKKEVEVDHGAHRTGTTDDSIIAKITTGSIRNNLGLARASRRLEQIREGINRCIQQFTPALFRQYGERIMSDELTMFKQRIDLVEYAAGQGFEVKADKSSNHTTIMKNRETGVVIGISLADAGHHIYSSFSDDSGGGSVIDFTMKIQGAQNLGFARKILRNYLGSPRPIVRSLPKPQKRPPKAERERELRVDINAAIPMKRSWYLKSRGISQDILDDPRFAGRIWTDNFKNVRFPHIGADGKLLGFEKKNHNFKGYTKYGDKGVWMSNSPGAGFSQIIICESGIDALSHAQLHPENAGTAVYISIGGNMSIEQEALLKTVIDRNPEAELVAAFDHDDSGTGYYKDLLSLAGSRPVVNGLPAEPGADWNQVLQDGQEEDLNDRPEL